MDFPPQLILLVWVLGELHELTGCITLNTIASFKTTEHQKIKYTELSAQKEVAGMI